ncbi:hypothetical protein GWK47_004838 [Chionoecetes opilio]|uniref:Uncharacterized protein n=1 Tax=Chionoecetes opilio TaxID=41210 RepID=A0A8J5D0E8_CHIOP|nr:hypothetical protein GWK47_004838 [Chionoecetes opilio]
MRSDGLLQIIREVKLLAVAAFHCGDAFPVEEEGIQQWKGSDVPRCSLRIQRAIRAPNPASLSFTSDYRRLTAWRVTFTSFKVPKMSAKYASFIRNSGFFVFFPWR